MLDDHIQYILVVVCLCLFLFISLYASPLYAPPPPLYASMCGNLLLALLSHKCTGYVLSTINLWIDSAHSSTNGNKHKERVFVCVCFVWLCLHRVCSTYYVHSNFYTVYLYVVWNEKLWIGKLIQLWTYFLRYIYPFSYMKS